MALVSVASDDESQRHDDFSCFRLPVVVNGDGANDRDALRDRREILVIVTRERIANDE